MQFVLCCVQMNWTEHGVKRGSLQRGNRVDKDEGMEDNSLYSGRETGTPAHLSVCLTCLSTCVNAGGLAVFTISLKPSNQFSHSSQCWSGGWVEASPGCSIACIHCYRHTTKMTAHAGLVQHSHQSHHHRFPLVSEDCGNPWSCGGGRLLQLLHSVWWL